MKTILFLIAVATLAFSGCSSDAGVSVGHDGHSHGVSVSGDAGRGGIGVAGSAR